MLTTFQSLDYFTLQLSWLSSLLRWRCPHPWDNIVDTSYSRLYSFFWVVVSPPLDIPMLHPHTSLLHILMWLMTVCCLLPVSLQLCSSSDCSLIDCCLTDCPVSLLYISLASTPLQLDLTSYPPPILCSDDPPHCGLPSRSPPGSTSSRELLLALWSPPGHLPVSVVSTLSQCQFCVLST